MRNFSLLAIGSLIAAHFGSHSAHALTMCVSDLRDYSPAVHAVFLGLILAALRFAQRSYRRNHISGGLVGLLIAVSLAIAWCTPSQNEVHRLAARLPTMLLLPYLGLFFTRLGRPTTAAFLALLGLFAIGFEFTSYVGIAQKVSMLVFVVLLNAIHYSVFAMPKNIEQNKESASRMSAK